MLRPIHLALALLSALSASCAAYDFERQDVAFRHVQGSDALELILVSRGLLGTGQDSGDAVAADAAGARHVIVLGWPLEFDLDELEAELAKADEDEQLAARAAAWVSGIRLDSAVLWTDEDGKRSLYQRLTIPRASEGLALLSEVINAAVVRDTGWDELPPEIDPRTRELWEAHARAGAPWAAFERAGLAVRVPGSPAAAARWLAEALDGRDEALIAAAQALTELSVAGGVIELAFLPDATGWVRIRIERSADPDREGRKPVWIPETAPIGAPPRDVLDLFELPRRAAPSPGAGDGAGDEDR